MSNDLDMTISELSNDIDEIQQNIEDIMKRVSNNDQIIRNITENPDSIEAGTPKTGKFKVYGNSSNKEEFIQKVQNMKAVLEEANREEGE